MMILSRLCAIVAFTALFGCSTHPIQDRKTGLTIAQIDEKVRCEAAEAISELYDARDFDRSKQTYDAAVKFRKRLASAIDTLAANQEKLSFTATELRHERKILLFRSQQVDSLQQKAQRALDIAEKSETQKNIENARVALNAFAKANSEYDTDWQSYVRRSIAHNRQLIRHGRRNEKLVTSIKKFEKEFKSRLDLISNFLLTSFAYQLRFKIQEENKAGSTGSFTFPIHLGNVKVGWDASDTKDRTSERTIKLGTKFGSLIKALKEECHTFALAESRIPGHYPIVGRIGLKEVIEQYLVLSEDTDTKFTKEGESYTDVITFTTTLSAGVTPTVTVSPTTGHTVVADFSPTTKRIDIHEVFIALTPKSAKSILPDKVATERVVLVNEDLPIP